MGTDISMFAERLVDGNWVYIGKFEENSLHDPLDPESGPKIIAASLYNERNYELFTILANLFAYRPHYPKPIALPRGLPPDVSPEVATVAAVYGDDNHNSSWLLLSEVLAYDWQAFTGIRRKRKVSAEMARLIHPDKPWPNELVEDWKYTIPDDGIEVTWLETSGEVAESPFMIDVLDKLRRSTDNPDSLRLVFWFSS